MGILIVLMSAIVYAMVAKRLSQTPITAPIIFLSVGAILAYAGIIPLTEAEHMLHLVAEVTLIILLFLDAAKIDFKALFKTRAWPIRMLLIGLPLSVVFGAILAWFIFPSYPLVLLALIAAIMAPTDAALGQAVVTNPLVPRDERQSLTAESGLNDGLALPIILFLASMVVGLEGHGDTATNWVEFTALQLTFGPLVGVLLGWMGGTLFLHAESRQFTEPVYEGVAVLALAASSYVMAGLMGGNGFIAAFVAGLVFGIFVKGHCRFIYEFTESEGQMLTWGAFLFIGLVLLPEAVEQLDLRVVLYIFGSLFIVRPLAIYISLLGTNTKPLTRLFFGWFGPRGLATALFALLVVDGMQHDYAKAVLAVAINAVWISALLHGLSANISAKLYGAAQARANI